MLILKKSYTGHMRFIGEVFVKDLVKASIMQYCIEQVRTGRLKDSRTEGQIVI